MILGIARHGETDSNSMKLWVSDFDYPLNDKGKIQAKLLAASLKNYGFQQIVTSDKRRTIETAEIVSHELGIPIYGSFKIFRDRNYGPAEGLTSDEIYNKFGIRMRNSLTPELDLLPGAEKVEELRNRVIKGLNFLMNKFEESSVLLITHGAFARMAYRIINGDDQGIYFYNCSNFISECNNSKCKIIRGLEHINFDDSS